MTNQEIFDKVHTHLLTQQFAAIEDDACAYRTGTKACAVGALIPDALYTSEIEGQSVARLVSDYLNQKTFNPLHFALKQAGFTPEQYPLLRDLQRVHDRLMPRETDEFPSMARALCGLRLVAAKHSLTCPSYALTELDNVLDYVLDYLEYDKCPPQIK